MKAEMKMTMKICSFKSTFLSSSAVILFLASPTLATDFEWTGAVSTDWYDAANWDIGGVPATGTPGFNDTATINTTSNAPILPVGAGTQYLEIITIGATANGELTSSATINANGVSVGDAASGHGTLTVEGANGRVQADGFLTIGNAGTGVLNVANGGVATSGSVVFGSASSSVGSGKLLGAGSFLRTYGSGNEGLVIGGSGTGSLEVSDGAILESDQTIIGRDQGGSGTVLISGSKSEWNGYGDLIVGQAGTGEIRIDQGAHAVSNSISMGQENTSGSNVVTISGDGSNWKVYEDVSIGSADTTSGSLSILNGAVMTGSNAIVGTAEGSTGFARVDGTGSKWQLQAALLVGSSGDGELTVSDRGQMTADEMTIGVNATGNGTANIEGGVSSITLTNHATIGAEGKGTLNIRDDGVLNSNGGIIGRDNDSSGAVIVSDNATWTNISNLKVGEEGLGSLTIKSGSKVSNHTTVIGDAEDGAGVVTVTGDESAWTVDGGITVGENGTGDLRVDNQAHVTSTESTIGSMTGSTGDALVSGTGSLWDVNGDLIVGVKGDGSLLLADEGTVSTDSLHLAVDGVSTGSLNIGAASGDAAVAAGILDSDVVEFGNGDGRIVFNHTETDYQFKADISGSGDLSVESGITILTGGNTNSGETSILSGAILQVGDGGTRGTLGGDVDIASGGTLDFNRSDDLEFDGIISGAGDLLKNGEGDLVFTADSDAFSGTAGVLDGTLIVKGTLRGSLIDVAADAAIGGSGTIGNTHINTGGTFQAGDKDGSITVDGDLEFESGATYVTVITSKQEPAIVTGDVAFNNTAIEVELDQNGELKNSVEFLQANEITGTYDATLKALPSQFRGAVKDIDNSLYLTLDYVDGDFHFSKLGRGVNEQLVKAFNDGQTLSGTLSAAMLLGDEAYESAMTTLGGELGVNATMTASLGMQDFLRRATNPHRLLAGWEPTEEKQGDEALPSEALGYWAVGNENGYDFSTSGHQPPRWDWASAGRGSTFRSFSPVNTAWLEYNNETVSVSGDAATGNSGADIKGSVFEGGYLARLDDFTQVGFVFGGGQTTYNQTEQNGTATDQGLRAAVNVVGQTKQGLYGLAALGVGVDSMETERTVSFGTMADKLRGSYSTTSVGGRVEAGARIVNNGFALIPFAGASIAYTSAPDYEEEVTSGTGQSALAYSDTEIFRGTVEAGLGFDTAAGNVSRRFSLNSRVSYLYRYGSDGDASASFLSLPGYGFTVTSNAPLGGAIAANIGARLQLSSQVDLSFNAYGEWATDYSTLIASAKLRYIW